MGIRFFHCIVGVLAAMSWLTGCGTSSGGGGGVAPVSCALDGSCPVGFTCSAAKICLLATDVTSYGDVYASDAALPDVAATDSQFGTDKLDTVGKADSGPDGTDAATQDTKPVASSYESLVIWDQSADPSFVNGKCGASPGADIDCVGLYRGGKLIGVGKIGTANYAASPASTCENNKNSVASVEGPLNGHVYASSPDVGYVSLNGGSIEIQFGACKTGSTITDCDGAGALVPLLPGDEVDVWEVDTTYKSGSGGPADGNAYDGCICYPDEYEVTVRSKLGADAGSVSLPAPGTGNSADKKWFAGSTTVKIP